MAYVSNNFYILKNDHQTNNFEEGSVDHLFQMVKEGHQSQFRYANANNLKSMCAMAQVNIERRHQELQDAATGLSNQQWDNSFHRYLTCSTESKSIYIILKLLPYIGDENETFIIISMLMQIVENGSYPEEILVAEGLASHLLTNYSSRLADIYFLTKVHKLFLKMLRHEKIGEFSCIRRAAVAFFNEFGRLGTFYGTTLRFSEEEIKEGIALLQKPDWSSLPF
ncbi:hypothetical protein DFA_00250 [Cavenderia fasciculata]|uniref:Uncharacterized protein n=1 Tax=Cavenderia fasciculata TaxID=261658 RepID=F4PY12_CACFS|nr:uncharacterized protein DFA_00250 [Cavenderia fasciculata]EGG19672.1 hypothetical protein DFA_00250 [Cavenderia fasciculata]|eukprot:XP_004357966.1 hypothetical protein DFA_00250 [Cavenderia fasciculata]